MVFFIRSVDSCNCLQQIMVFQFSTKIQAFLSWCIKSGKKHIENDKNINCHIIFDEIQAELNKDASMKSHLRAGLILHDSDDKDTRERLLMTSKII